MFEIIIFLNALANATSANPIIYPPINVPVGTAIIGALIGAIVAFVLITNHDRSKENKVIKKIQSLISDDLERIYDLAKSDIKKINEDNIKFKIDKNLDELMSEKLSIEEFILKYSNSFELNFWNAIVSSGSLIKLSRDDIKDTQAIVDTISLVNEDISSLSKQTKVNFQSAYSEDREHLNTTITDFLGDQMAICEGLVEALEEISIKWLKFE